MLAATALAGWRRASALPVLASSPETASFRLPGQGLQKLSRSRCHRIIWSFRAPVISRSVSSPETETHQSPIWLKADGGDPLSGPWLTCSPRKSSVPNRVQVIRSQISGSPCVHGPNPGWFTAWALSFPFERPHRRRVGWDSGQSDLVVVNQPHWLVSCPSHP